jgi:hypothetical protein
MPATMRASYRNPGSRHARNAVSRPFRGAAGRRRHPECRPYGVGRIDPRRPRREGQSIPCEHDRGRSRGLGGSEDGRECRADVDGRARPARAGAAAPRRAHVARASARRSKQPAFQIAGTGATAAPNLAALTATPQLTNLLPQRPNPFGLKIAPFSLRG